MVIFEYGFQWVFIFEWAFVFELLFIFEWAFVFEFAVHFRVGIRFRFGVHLQVGLRFRAVFVFEKVNTPPNSKNFVLTHFLARAMISTRKIMEFFHHLNLQFRIRCRISQLNTSAVVRYNMLMQRPTLPFSTYPPIKS